MDRSTNRVGMLNSNRAPGHSRIRLSDGWVAALGLLTVAIAGTKSIALPLLQYEATLTLPRESGRAGLPVAVTAGFDGIEVCVTDGTTNSAHLFNASNIHIFDTGLAAGLAQPMDVAVDSSGGFVSISTANPKPISRNLLWTAGSRIISFSLATATTSPPTRPTGS